MNSPDLRTRYETLGGRRQQNLWIGVALIVLLLTLPHTRALGPWSMRLSMIAVITWGLTPSVWGLIHAWPRERVVHLEHRSGLLILGGLNLFLLTGVLGLNHGHRSTQAVLLVLTLGMLWLAWKYPPD